MKLDLNKNPNLNWMKDMDLQKSSDEKIIVLSDEKIEEMLCEFGPESLYDLGHKLIRVVIDDMQTGIEQSLKEEI